jgi:hypothetical protein
VTIFRRLVEAGSGDFLPDLAMALWGYARVRQAGNLEVAEAASSAAEAIKIYQELGEKDSTPYTDYLSDVRATLQRLLDMQ